MLKLCINHKNVKNQTILPVTSFETLSVEWSISRSMEFSAPSVTWDGARASAVADEPKRTVIRTLGGGEEESKKLTITTRKRWRMCLLKFSMITTI